MEKVLKLLEQIKNNKPFVYGFTGIYVRTLVANEPSKIKEAISIVEEAMKPKTCDGCIDEIISSNRCEFCIRTHPQDFYVAKDNA